MGTVWRAYDNELEIEVALKLLRNTGADRSAMLERFAHEAELSARMLSPNVVRVIDRGVDDTGFPYIAYELLEGDELGERLTREGRLSLSICAAIVVQTCRALARAHAVGVIHQDIKPENIFLCQDAEDDARPIVKLIDFGIAQLNRPISGNASRDAVGGTLEYMAPEVLLDGSVPDARSDLYALGVVAYECFTGRVPFQGDTLSQVLIAHTQTKPPAASSLRGVKDGLGAALDAWFAHALHRDPDQRFQTAKEMAEAFVHVHRPKTAHGPTSVAPPPHVRSPSTPPMPHQASDPARKIRRSFPSLSDIDLGEIPDLSARPEVPEPPTGVRARPQLNERQGNPRLSSEYKMITDPTELHPRQPTKKKSQ